MAKGNGKSRESGSHLDLEHELPPAEAGDGFTERAADEPQQPASATGDELQKLRTERDSLLDRLARVQAEFENYRKRSAREQQDFREYAVADALKSLLPVLDSFELALKNASAKADEGGMRSGLELMRKQFQDALAKLGVREIEARGAAFDPQWHQAVEMVETDQAEDNHVLEELQRGYKLKDRLLRPAMVRVAHNTHK
ncbi:MAG: nucleotide exchange factor GrpE [Acidobacteriales bacterium]|nr:nucleotide exchange factor GrpE [Terriglobales bacterium]